MNNFLKVALFSLIVIGIYTLYSVKIIPPIAPEEPPREEASEKPKTVEELVSLGEQVYNGKGACALCHSPVAGRAPLLDNAAVIAADRVKEKGYKGKAVDAEGYLFESLSDPSAFVVPGYGLAGTKDTVSPMPAVQASAIGLSEIEIRAVVAYLQHLSGVEVTVKPEEKGKSDEVTNK